MFNHPNFRNDNIATQAFNSVNCGAQLADGHYNPCSLTNNVISAQTTTNNFGQSTGQVGNAGRQIQYGCAPYVLAKLVSESNQPPNGGT